MAKQTTYTDIKNIEAKTEALEAVNVYMSKRRDARSTMKQVEDEYKEIEQWTDLEGNVHITSGILDKTTGKYSGVTTEVYKGAGKKTPPTEKTIYTFEDVKKTAEAYNLTEEFKDKLNVRTLMEKGIDPKSVAGQTLFKDTIADIKNWTESSKGDSGRKYSTEALTSLLESYKDKLTPAEYEDFKSKINKPALSDEATNQARLKKVETNLLNFATYKEPSKDGGPSVYTYDGVKAAIAASGLVGDELIKMNKQLDKTKSAGLGDKSKQEFFKNIIKKVTALEEDDDGKAKKEMLSLETVKDYVSTRLGNTPLANQYIAAAIKASESKDVTVQQGIYKDILSDTDREGGKVVSKESDPDLFKFGELHKMVTKEMINEGYKANPNWSAVSDPNYTISPKMKQLYRNVQRAKIMSRYHTQGMSYDGQVVMDITNEKGEVEQEAWKQIQLVDDEGAEHPIMNSEWMNEFLTTKKVGKDLMDKLYVKNPDGTMTPKLSREESNVLIKQTLYNYVKRLQDAGYYPAHKWIYITSEPTRHDFDREKNIFEKYNIQTGSGIPQSPPD